MIKKGFIKINERWILQDVSDIVPLPVGIYVLCIDDRGNLFLQQKADDKFRFDFKVYGIERPFIHKVKTAYHNTGGNMGILLNGIQGTGKTITGQMISNELNLPTILITGKYPGLNEYLSSFQQDITLFIDEYEKVFKGSISEDDYDYDRSDNSKGDDTLLSLMSGVHTSAYRRFFILTTNKTWINENMLNRPGRLLFVKNFTDLKKEQIDEIISDLLVETKYKDEIYEYMKPLKIITIDIVKTIVNLVNIFKVCPQVACEDLNVEFKDECYDIYMIEKDKKETLLEERVAYNRVKTFLMAGPYQGKQIRTEDGNIYALAAQPKDNIFVVNKDYTQTKIKIILKKAMRVHSSLVF